MASIKAKIRSAIRAFRNPPSDISAATVRPYETNQHYGRRQQMQFGELVGMFAGTVKVATMRTAAGVASNRLRVMRAKAARSTYEARALDRREALFVRKSAGLFAQKAAARAEDLEEITDPVHPLVLLLSEINAFNNPYDFMEGTQAWLCLTGQGYWKVARDPSGNPLELWPLPPQFVHVLPDAEKIIGGYVYGRGMEIERRYDPADVVHFRYTNPRGDPYYGLGDLAACVAEAKLGFEFVAMAQAMIDNGGIGGLTIQADITEPQQKQLETSLTAKHAGPQNYGRHKILRLPDTAKIIQSTLGKQEVAFLTSSERVDQVVANCFDMPVEFLRMKPGGLSGNSDSMYWWQTYGLAPRGRKIEDTINSWIKREAARGSLGYDGVFVCFSEWVRQDEERAAAIAVNGYNAELLTKNEGRRRLGEEPVPEGDDFKERPEPAAGFGGFGANNDKGEGGNGGGAGGKASKGNPPHVAVRERGAGGDGYFIGDEVGTQREGALLHQRTTRFHSHSNGVATVATAISCAAMLWVAEPAKCCTRHPPMVLKDQVSVDIISLTERQLETALRAFFQGITPDVLGSVTEGGIGLDIGASAVLDRAFSDVVERVLLNLYHAGLFAGAGDVAGRVDAAKLREALTERAQAYLRSHVQPLWRSVSGTVQTRVENALADSIAAGATLPEMKQAVATAMGRVADTGAEMIARTESSRAFHAARERAWIDSGVVERKEWVLSADPCEFCMAMAETYNSAKLGKPFLKLGQTLTGAYGGEIAIDYTAITNPPLHPNCVLPGTRVAAGGVIAATRAWYRGNVVTIRTAHGRSITVTENHYLLGARGFLCAASLRVGDDLVCAGIGQDPFRPHMDNRPPTAAQIFGSHRLAGSMSAGRVPSAPEHFHGDGVSLDGEIDVVFTDRLLRGRRGAAYAQQVCERRLLEADIGMVDFSGSSNLDAMLLSLRFAAYGRVSCAREALSLCRSGSAHPDVHCLGASAWNDPVLAKPESYGATTNAVPMGECLDGLSGLVATDKIVEVNKSVYSGPVHDFSTVSGAYIGNGIVAHNCRCAIDAVLSEEA